MIFIWLVVGTMIAIFLLLIYSMCQVSQEADRQANYSEGSQ
ncbi:MAG: hypothetical protein RR641_07905 [Erysipelotrichaceae bacterium]